MRGQLLATATSALTSATWMLPSMGVWISGAQDGAAQQLPGEERLLGADVEPSGITFRVLSSGCTRKASFGVETLSRHPLTLRLVRVTPDDCEASLPKGMKVRFGFAELGVGPRLEGKDLQSVVIVNERVRP